MNIKFGVFLDPLYLPSAYALLRDQAINAEKLGYDSLWISDHLISEYKPVVEFYTTLSALASITHTIKLGSLVACNSYRLSSLLAS